MEHLGQLLAAETCDWNCNHEWLDIVTWESLDQDDDDENFVSMYMSIYSFYKVIEDTIKLKLR